MIENQENDPLLVENRPTAVFFFLYGTVIKEEDALLGIRRKQLDFFFTSFDS